MAEIWFLHPLMKIWLKNTYIASILFLMSLDNELKDPFVQHAQLFHSRSICFDEGSVDLTTKFHQTNSSDDMVGELLGAKAVVTQGIIAMIPKCVYHMTA